MAETRYHRERFLARSSEAPLHTDLRSYASNIDSEFHDIRRLRLERPELYDPDNYGASQALAALLLNDHSNGIVYDSVRHDGGECVAIFRANIPQPVLHGSHYGFYWDGDSIVDTYIKTRVPG